MPEHCAAIAWLEQSIQLPLQAIGRDYSYYTVSSKIKPELPFETILR